MCAATMENPFPDLYCPPIAKATTADSFRVMKYFPQGLIADDQFVFSLKRWNPAEVSSSPRGSSCNSVSESSQTT